MDRMTDAQPASRRDKLKGAGSPPETSTNEADEAGLIADAPRGLSLSEADAHHATHLRETTAAIYLGAASATMLRGVGPEAYAAYMRGILADAGAPTDPIEQQMIEQLTIVHHAVARLCYQASTAETPEVAGIFLTALARLMGEHRKAALALRTYRAGVSTTQVTVTQSQAGAQGGPRIAILAGGETNLVDTPMGKLEEAPGGRPARTA